MKISYDAIGSILVTLAFMANAYAESNQDWHRLEGSVMQSAPVEQQGMEAEELDEIDVISRYQVTQTIGGISYYDPKSKMTCHVVTDANLLRPMGITCAPTAKPKK